ncbi:methylated-DNA--[protein]-cysteine S-methyltransferase [Pusillimonas sp. DMV24BSW_D]|nr:methylated-DNA--[protein]-cysteine S-methyltransferase [Pusillimonas sp. DMV24BSW_D]
MLRRYRVFTRSANTGKALRHPLYTKVNWQRGVAAEDANRAQSANESVPDSVLSYFEQTMKELDAYFRGRLTYFSVPLSLKGTHFQVKVWETLAKLPEDQLISYGELGRTAGVSPGAYRAVGVAVGRNPVSIIVPCHRVVAADARLTGYGGGLERKVALLEHEGFQLR